MEVANPKTLECHMLDAPQESQIWSGEVFSILSWTQRAIDFTKHFAGWHWLMENDIKVIHFFVKVTQSLTLV